MTKEPTYNKKFLAEQRTALKSKATGYGEHFRLLGAGVTTGKDNLVCKDNVSCFGSFPSIKYDSLVSDTFKAEVLLVWHDHAPKTDPVKAYIDWCINASPYNEVFLDKDVDSLYDMPVALNCHFHARMVIGAGILIRYRTQMIERINSWYNMVRRGIHPDLAFVICHHVESIKEGLMANPDYGGHGLWEPQRSTISAAKNFLAHDNKLAPDMPHNVHLGYYSYAGLWSAWAGGNNKQFSLPKFTDEVRVKTGWGNEHKVINCVRWENLDRFLEKVLELNDCEEEYAAAIKRDKKRAKRVA